MKKTKINKTGNRSLSSHNWLQEHVSDIYVKKAKQDGFRARSAYKLMEIQERYKIIKPNMCTVDLGAAPGSWSEYLSHIVDFKGKIFALDILPMQSLSGVEFIQGDFTLDSVVKELELRLNGVKIDVVLSDMAPNLSGLDIVDQARSINLAQRALNFARIVLKPKGVFLTKIFHGSESEGFLKDLRKYFDEVKVVKPDASRARSKEVYLLARGFK